MTSSRRTTLVLTSVSVYLVSLVGGIVMAPVFSPEANIILSQKWAGDGAPLLPLFNKFTRIRAQTEDEDSAQLEYAPQLGVIMKDPIRVEPEPGALEQLGAAAREAGLEAVRKGTDYVGSFFGPPTPQYIVTEFESPKQLFTVEKVLSPTLAIVKRTNKAAGSGCCGMGKKNEKVGSGVLRFETDCEDMDTSHALVNEFAFLTLLAGKHIAVRPVYVSPPSLTGKKINGCDEKLRFLVFKRPGYSLRYLMEAGGTMKADKALRLTRKLALVIGDMHRLGVSHGSITSSNVHLKEGSDPSKGLRLVDFKHATLDSRGLHTGPTLQDLHAIYVILTEMHPALSKLVGPGPPSSGQPSAPTMQYGKRKSVLYERLQGPIRELYQLTIKVTQIREIQYRKIDLAIRAALWECAVSGIGR